MKRPFFDCEYLCSAMRAHTLEFLEVYQKLDRSNISEGCRLEEGPAGSSTTEQFYNADIDSRQRIMTLTSTTREAVSSMNLRK